MQHIEGNFKGKRAVNISYQAWIPAGEIKAVLLVVHGMGEHCGRNMNVVNHFVPLGYAVYGLDHIGHGKSGGRREFVERFEDFTATLAIFYREVAHWQENKPIFFLGHSLGGTIVLVYLLDYPNDFCGAILSAPAVRVAVLIPQAALTIGKFFSRLTPNIGLFKLNALNISSDPGVVEAYINDPLIFHGRTPIRLAVELFAAMGRIAAEAKKITLPLIILQGSADRLIDPAGAKMLYDKASSKDKTLRIYDGLYHEVFNEPERDRVLTDVETWLAAHV
jgi:alpha-beta hydrolase superfamily lysophospholipase